MEIKGGIVKLIRNAEAAVDATRDGINASLVIASIAIVIAAVALMMAVSKNA